jgi:hypothetical protein
LKRTRERITIKESSHRESMIKEYYFQEARSLTTDQKINLRNDKMKYLENENTLTHKSFDEY